MADPLAFFAGEGSSSDSEEEEATNQKEKNTDDDGSQDGAGDKLPSPNSLFKSVSRPTFLDNPNEKYIDWDRFVKNSESEEPNIHESGNYAAIPPPSSLANSGTVSSKLTRSILGSGVVEYSSPPVEYSSSDSTVSNASANTQQAGSKRPQENVAEPQAPGSGGGGSAPSSKKMKTDHFRVKEKRKRDLGQTSRGKSYVEEEKRILRQQFKSDEILS